MEVYLNYINDYVENFTETEKNIFKKSLLLLNDSLDYSRIKAFEYSIQKKYYKILDFLLEINSEIDVCINNYVGKYYDIDVIKKLIPFGLDLDLVIKTSFQNYSISDETNIIELTTLDEFKKTDKSYLLSYSAHYGFDSLLELILKEYKHKNKLEVNHSLLHAIYNNQIKCIEILIENGADINNFIECTKDCNIGKYNNNKLCKISCMA